MTLTQWWRLEHTGILVEPHQTDDVSNQRVTIGKSYSGRHNSLNFLRLVLALLVVVSPTIVLGGYGSESIFGKTTLGTMAVYGFFGISGFLIAGSAVHNDPGNYFWRRFLRIFPGFWVCLLVTAFFFGLVGWLTGTIPAGYHSGASRAYFRAPHGPMEFCLQNICSEDAPAVHRQQGMGSSVERIPVDALLRVPLLHPARWVGGPRVLETAVDRTCPFSRVMGCGGCHHDYTECQSPVQSSQQL